MFKEPPAFLIISGSSKERIENISKEDLMSK